LTTRAFETIFLVYYKVPSDLAPCDLAGDKHLFYRFHSILCHTNHQITSYWHQYNTKIM